MIHCLIIDDEPLALQLLAQYAERSTDLVLIKTFSNPIEALHFLNSHTIDLVFLDIQMPELTGIQLMKIINQKYEIIVTTAYSNYALEGYEFDVVDYLLKPISLDRFLIAVEKVKKRLSSSTERIKTSSAKKFFFVKSGHKTLRINFVDILRLESQGDYVAIILPHKIVLTLENLSYFEGVLPTDNFIRIHRSHIICLSKIDFIERNRVVINKAFIPISISYQKKFQEKIKY